MRKLTSTLYIDHFGNSWSSLWCSSMTRVPFTTRMNRVNWVRLWTIQSNVLLKLVNEKNELRSKQCDQNLQIYHEALIQCFSFDFSLVLFIFLFFGFSGSLNYACVTAPSPLQEKEEHAKESFFDRNYLYNYIFCIINWSNLNICYLSFLWSF